MGGVLSEEPGDERAQAEAAHFAAVATRDARRLAEAGTSSVSAAVAVPVIRPAESPDKIRPTNSTPTLGAKMNTTVLSVVLASATANTGLRPAWSEDRPASSRAARTPAA